MDRPQHEHYQPLFDLLAQEHGVIATPTEMQDIVECVKTMGNDKAWEALIRISKCDYNWHPQEAIQIAKEIVGDDHGS